MLSDVVPLTWCKDGDGDPNFSLPYIMMFHHETNPSSSLVSAIDHHTNLPSEGLVVKGSKSATSLSCNMVWKQMRAVMKMVPRLLSGFIVELTTLLNVLVQVEPFDARTCSPSHSVGPRVMCLSARCTDRTPESDRAQESL